MRTPKTVVRGVFVCFILLGALLFTNKNVLGSVFGWNQSGVDGRGLSSDLTPTPTPSPTPTPIYLQLPLVFRLSDIELNGAWIYNSEGKVQYGFQPGDAIQFVAELANYSGYDVTVNLNWSQDGPCGEATLVVNKELKLEPGVMKIGTDDVAPDCYGVYTNLIEMSFGAQTESLEFRSIVINPSSVILADGQGFDKCSLPTVNQMATWWKESPYSTANIYIGGISGACPMNQDSGWLYQVAEQGWSFILTWVGPQAPCTSFKHQMSRDPDKAYQQGREEAEAAAEAAMRIGFLGDNVIYYDVESYSRGFDDPVCRQAVASLLQGWTERLHEIGYKSGAYGSPCSSFISEWAENDDPPDDVWLAHWYTNNYDEDADVMDAPCLSNDLWVDHQRLKQYTGGHKEKWGDIQMTIDSNVLDGQVSAILDFPSDQGSDQLAGNGSSIATLAASEPSVTDFQLLSQTEGWIGYGDRLHWTSDSGSSWREITPQSAGQQQILGTVFLNTRQGWSVTRSYTGLQDGSLSVLRTEDGGFTWEAYPIPDLSPSEISEVEKVYLDFVDPNTGWITLKLQSSSNFSLGRLFATRDGGRTWEERTTPLGEAVEFLDVDRGWVAGGPAGDQFFRSVDGGRTWQSQDLPRPDSGQTEIGLPVFEDKVSGALSLVQMDKNGSRLLMFTTADAGESWSLSEIIQISESDVQFASGLTLNNRVMGGEFPKGVVALEAFDNQHGWALVQNGFCAGYKPRAGEIAPLDSPPLQCESHSNLLVTTDGGVSWREMSPPQ